MTPNLIFLLSYIPNYLIWTQKTRGTIPAFTNSLKVPFHHNSNPAHFGVLVTWVYTFFKIYWVMYLRYGHFIVCNVYLKKEKVIERDRDGGRKQMLPPRLRACPHLPQEFYCAPCEVGWLCFIWGCFWWRHSFCSLEGSSLGYVPELKMYEVMTPLCGGPKDWHLQCQIFSFIKENVFSGFIYSELCAWSTWFLYFQNARGSRGLEREVCQPARFCKHNYLRKS